MALMFARQSGLPDPAEHIRHSVNKQTQTPVCAEPFKVDLVLRGPGRVALQSLIRLGAHAAHVLVDVYGSAFPRFEC